MNSLKLAEANYLKAMYVVIWKFWVFALVMENADDYYCAEVVAGFEGCFVCDYDDARFERRLL